VRQPFRRRITYVFTMPSSVVVFVDPRSAHAVAHRENHRGWAAALRRRGPHRRPGGGARRTPRRRAGALARSRSSTSPRRVAREPRSWSPPRACSPPPSWQTSSPRC